MSEPMVEGGEAQPERRARGDGGATDFAFALLQVRLTNAQHERDNARLLVAITDETILRLRRRLGAASAACILLAAVVAYLLLAR